MSPTKPWRTGVRVDVRGYDVRWVGDLGVLFKEILQQVPAEYAKVAMEGYNAGQTITLCIGESSYGPDRKTAFYMGLTDSQAWRANLPDDEQGVVQ
jgi:hypothetical protein